MKEALEKNIQKLRINIDNVGLEVLKKKYRNAYTKLRDEIVLGIKEEMIGIIRNTYKQSRFSHPWDEIIMQGIQKVTTEYCKKFSEAMKNANIEVFRELFDSYENEIAKETDYFVDHGSVATNIVIIWNQKAEKKEYIMTDTSCVPYNQ